MKKNYIAPISAQMMVNLTIMSGSPAAELQNSGTTGTGEPAMAPGRKLYI